MRSGILHPHHSLARHHGLKPLWGGPMNLFGLLFAFLLALALILLFLFWWEASQRQKNAPTEPTRTVWHGSANRLPGAG